MNTSRLLLAPLFCAALVSASHAGRVPDLRSFGAPSIDVEATWNDTLNFEDGDGGLDLWNFRLGAPVWGTKVGDDVYALQFKHDWTQFDLGSSAAFGEIDLHSLDLSARWAHLPKENGWIGLVSLSGGVGTDFDGFTGDAWQGSALGFFGWQVSPRFSWAVAAYASYALGEVQAYPSLGFVWSPSEAWRIQLTPPLALISWKPSEDWRASLSFLPNGGGWQVKKRDGVEQVDLSLWSASVSVERRLVEKLYLTVRGGVNLGGEVELRDNQEIVKLGRDLDPAAFASVGLSWEF